MQKVLMMTTESETLRSKVIGWHCEDGNAVLKAFQDRLCTGYEYKNQNELPVALIGGSLSNYLYPTVLHALGHDWKLLAPPTSYEETWDTEEKNKHTVTLWSWWLVKD